MKEEFLVSILIPVYNRENLIEETIKSALTQTYTNIEVIVVDNKSTDNTWKVLTNLALEDRRVKIFQNETNIGPVRNWKRCIDEASGTYGKILWSDDLIAPTFLEKTVPYLSKEDVGFVFTGTEIFVDGTNKKSSHYFIGESGLYECEEYINGVLFKGGYPVSPACALFKLKDLQKNLLIDIPNKIESDFSMHAIGNDVLIFLLTTNAYSHFAFVNEKLSFFRAHEGSISIQANNGKLPLHYSLASAYFVENFRKDLLEKLNAKIWLELKRYRKSIAKYNMRNIESFYVSNLNYSIDYAYIINRVTRKFLSMYRNITNE